MIKMTADDANPGSFTIELDEGSPSIKKVVVTGDAARMTRVKFGSHGILEINLDANGDGNREINRLKEELEAQADDHRLELREMRRRAIRRKRKASLKKNAPQNNKGRKS